MLLDLLGQNALIILLDLLKILDSIAITLQHILKQRVLDEYFVTSGQVLMLINAYSFLEYLDAK